MVIVALLSVTGTLLFAVGNQLQMGGPSVSSPTEMGFIAICYFVLPVLIAHTVSMNWSVSRILIFAYASAVAFQGFQYVARVHATPVYKGAVATGIVLALLIVLWWLFYSRRLRLYYSLISHTGIPEDLDAPPEELALPGRIEALLGSVARRIAPWLEQGVIALVFITLALALWSAES